MQKLSSKITLVRTMVIDAILGINNNDMSTMYTKCSSLLVANICIIEFILWSLLLVKTHKYGILNDCCHTMSCQSF